MVLSAAICENRCQSIGNYCCLSYRFLLLMSTIPWSLLLLLLLVADFCCCFHLLLFYAVLSKNAVKIAPTSPPNGPQKPPNGSQNASTMIPWSSLGPPGAPKSHLMLWGSILESILDPKRDPKIDQNWVFFRKMVLQRLLGHVCLALRGFSC